MTVPVEESVLLMLAEQQHRASTHRIVIPTLSHTTSPVASANACCVARAISGSGVVDR